jgi:hypothetical protein
VTPTIPSDGIPCNVFVELVTEYLDSSLPDGVVARIDEHLAVCPGCVSVLEQFRVVIGYAGRIGERDVDTIEPAVRAELMQAFREATTRGR